MMAQHPPEKIEDLLEINNIKLDDDNNIGIYFFITNYLIFKKFFKIK